MEELIAIFNEIKKEFCSLWAFKQRGETLEIITPITTTSNKFVSVFLTCKNKEFVVSDGGWLSNETYETEMDLEEESFSKIFAYYQKFYDIQVVNVNDVDFYFKKSPKKQLIANLVFDIANFVSAIASNSQITFIDLNEKKERTRFNKQANIYLKSIFPNKVSFRSSIDNKLKNIKFSAIIKEATNRISLINYVTGSTAEYFSASIAKANITFEVISKTEFKSLINHKIALINSTTAGFDGIRLAPFLSQLETTTNNKNIMWHEKERLISLN